MPKDAEPALRRLALPHKACTFWIDAARIHQKDLVERVQQIVKMVAVYNSRETNLILLGKIDRTSQSTISSVEAIRRDIHTGIESEEPDHEMVVNLAQSGMRLCPVLDINALTKNFLLSLVRMSFEHHLKQDIQSLASIKPTLGVTSGRFGTKEHVYP